MDDIIAKLSEKLDPAVQRLRDGKHDDHDILPGLLWLLLEYNRSHRDDLEKLRNQAETTSAGITSVAKALQDECEKLRHGTSELVTKAGSEIAAKIALLAQTLQEECEKLRGQLGNITDSIKSSTEDLRQTLQQNTVQLQKLVETRVDALTGAHQSGLRRTDNKLRWILIGSILQIVSILIIMFLLFGKPIYG